MEILKSLAFNIDYNTIFHVNSNFPILSPRPLPFNPLNNDVFKIILTA